MPKESRRERDKRLSKLVLEIFADSSHAPEGYQTGYGSDTNSYDITIGPDGRRAKVKKPENPEDRFR